MTFSSPHHSFDINCASKYGINCAIIIHHFQYWIGLNKRRKNKKSFHEGSWWTYQTQQEICDHFPYLSRHMVRTAIDNLVKEGILKTGNFNKMPLDKTRWYAFLNEDLWIKEEVEYQREEDEDSNNFYESKEMANGCPEMANALSGNGQAIPDTKYIYLKEEKESALARAKEASPQAPPSPPPRKTKNEPFKEVAREVRITQTQEDSLLEKFKGSHEMLKACYEKLSDWKLSNRMTGGKDDHKSMCKWTIKAVIDDFSTKGTSSTSRIQEDKKFAEEVKEKFKMDRNIEIGYNYLTFHFGPTRCDEIKFGESGFKERVMNNLRKMGLNL